MEKNENEMEYLELPSWYDTGERGGRKGGGVLKICGNTRRNQQIYSKSLNI